jgi:leucyl aminopeptidase
MHHYPYSRFGTDIKKRRAAMLSFSSQSPDRTSIEILAIPAAQDAALHAEPALQSIVSAAREYEEFSAEKDQKVLLYDPPGTKIRRCLIVGMGPKKKIDAEMLRLFAAQAVKAAIAAKRKRLLIAVPSSGHLALEDAAAIKALLEGAFLSNHAFEKYKAEPKHKALEEIALLLPAAEAKRHKTLLDNVTAVCGATLQAREWVNMPPNEKTPLQFAAMIKAAATAARLKVTILNEAQLRQRKFGALLPVGAGSSNPPCLVELVYAPPRAKETIVLVGKGVTFDTGGINLKPGAGLETMKCDMAGAAAVGAALTALARLKPRHRIVGILPLVENMISGQATRPSDIVVSHSGKTIEIGNTDAEGRLILADALHYARKKYKPDLMVDVATLTGACVMALGDRMAGLFCADDTLAEALLDAGRATHERCWRMPLPEDYKELLKSNLADIGNMPETRYGGAITAALFLSEFSGEGPWAHIDIAGPACLKKSPAYGAPGGTGFGVRLLCEWIMRMQ